MRRLTVCLYVLGAGISACAKSTAERSTEVAAIVLKDAAPQSTPVIGDIRSLGAQLEKERTSRPTTGLRVEDVLTGLNRAGVSTTPPRQVLAAIIGARYCATTDAGKELALAVCEFGNENEAQAGKKHSVETFKQVPNRELFLNGSTLLTLTRLLEGEASTRGAAQAAKAFAELPPAPQGSAKK